MRDAFGGTFMIQIFIVFILIYICFTAMSLNYAKAFRVKNAVIDFVETNEISSLKTLSKLVRILNIDDETIIKIGG